MTQWLAALKRGAFMLWLRWVHKLACVVLTITTASAWAQQCSDLSSERMVADQRGGCLALVPVAAAETEPKVLLVLLHGDSGGVLPQRQLEQWSELGKTLEAPGRQVVLMVRPGYRSPAGDSSGWANPRDDDYTEENISRVAGALAGLRQTYKVDKLVLVGHSGGAATAALVLGRHPSVADAAVLLACPCDVPPWREHRNAQRGRAGVWSRSLNPLVYVSGITAGAPVFAATGIQDDNTLPEFARRWVAQSVEAGVNARFEDVDGFGHANLLHWKGLAERVSWLVSQLYK